MSTKCLFILKNTLRQVMKFIAAIFVTLLAIEISEAQICTPIQGCDVTIGDSCYAYVDDSLNWNQAEECCVVWGGHLASIHSSDVNKVLNSIRNQSRWAWIGLSDTANVSEYVWTDGTPFDYENFADQPYNYTGEESCFHFFDTSYGALIWNDYDCSSNTYGTIVTSYICQKMISEAQICTPIQGCDVTIDDSCYAYVDDSINWNQAEECCVVWGGHLASIHSNDTNILLNSIRNQDRWAWIGLSDTATDGVYVWTDGTLYDYENFAPGEPTGPGGESCFHLYDTNIYDRALTWNDYLCINSTFKSILTSYICQKTPPSSPVVTLSQTDISCSNTLISWSTPSSDRLVTSYSVYRNNTLIYNGPANQYTDNTQLNISTVYEYSVVAISIAGTSTAGVNTISIGVTSLDTTPPLSLSYDNSANQLSIDWTLNPSQPINVTYRLELAYNYTHNVTYPYNETYTFSQTSTDTDYSLALTDRANYTNELDRIDITALLSITEQCDAPYSGVKITAVYSIEYTHIMTTTTTLSDTVPSFVVIIFIIIILVILLVLLSVIIALVIALVVLYRKTQQLTHTATPTAATHRCEYIDMNKVAEYIDMNKVADTFMSPARKAYDTDYIQMTATVL